MRVRTVVVLLVALALTLPGAVVGGGGNEQPLADAGLDQTVSIGDTVLLDAGGTRDPDGSIVAYEWRIVRPNGSTASPACRSCERTQFVPTTTGVYEVELTVTDDDGATSIDHLTVTVESAGGPTASLTGPRTADVGNTTRYRATVDAGDAHLSELVWRVNGSVVERVDLAGRHARKTLRWTFNTPGQHDVSVTAVDEDGDRASDSVGVSVTSASNDPPSVSISGPDRVVQGRWAGFTADASDPDGTVVDYSWSNVGPTPHRDRARRKFDESVGSLVTISVTVNDDDGAPATATKTVEVVGSEARSSVAETNVSTPRSTSTATSTPTDPVSTPNPEQTATAAGPPVKAAPEVRSIDFATTRNGEAGQQKDRQDILRDGVSEAEDTLMFTTEVYVGTLERDDQLKVVFDFGDGSTKTVHDKIHKVDVDSTVTVSATHTFADVDEMMSRSVTITVYGDGTTQDSLSTPSIEFRPANENALRYALDVSGTSVVETGSAAIFDVGNKNDSVEAPPKVKVMFGDGTKEFIEPDGNQDFDTTTSRTYDTTGTHTVTASVVTQTTGAQASGATHTVEVKAATYTVYEWFDKKTNDHSKTKTSTDKPGPSWEYVKTVGSTQESTGDKITVPASMSGPEASMSGHRWKSTGTFYDPMLDQQMEMFEKYRVEDKVKWKKEWETTSQGEFHETLYEPRSWKVYGNTLTTTGYKCTNDNAPNQGRACTSQNGNNPT